MARKYSRDNRGRFAGGGGGATARGGRLRTAAGNKRKTQTMESAAKPKGTIGKPKGLKPGTIKAKAAAAKTAPKASVKKLGSRLNPAKKADRAATKQFDKAYNREQRIRASLFSGNKTQAKKDAIVKELKKASDTTGAKLQQRREIRARSPVQSKDKALRASGIAGKKGTIIKNKDVRNQQNRKAAFVRKIERVPRASFNPSNKKERQTARVSARARAVYQGTKRPDKSDATIGNITNARVSKGYKAPSSRLAAPSRAAIRSGKALANKATGSARDKFGRRMMNPLKGTKKARTAARALKFYKNPKATAQQVLKDQGKAGKRTKGFRLPRTMR